MKHARSGSPATIARQSATRCALRPFALCALWFGLSSCDQPVAEATPCLHWEPGMSIRTIEHVAAIELLFVVDPSAAPLPGDAIPRLVASLARDDSARPIRAGVITTDLGSGRHALASCPRPWGDDGVLLDASSCGGEERFLRWERGLDASTFASELSCTLSLVGGACTVRQPLEAALAAISPPSFLWPDGYVPPEFASGGYGHGDGENRGFHEDSAMLVIILISDRDDCSLADAGLFDPTDARYAATPEGLRCVRHPEALTAIARYAAAAERGSGLSTHNTAGVLFVPIVGIPPEAVPSESGSIDYDAILARDDMRAAADPAMPDRQRPSCEVPGHGPAYPPRRILETARELDLAGGSVLLRSLCTSDLGAVMDDLGATIVERVRRARGGCFPGYLSDGCEILVPMAPGERCVDRPGLTYALERDGAEVCYLQRSTDGIGPGWLVERSLESPLGSDIRDICGDYDAAWITFVPEGSMPSSAELVCHRTLAPDGGICAP